MYAFMLPASLRVRALASGRHLRPLVRAAVVASTAVLASACAQSNLSLTALSGPSESSGITTASNAGPASATPAAVQGELGKATAYWGEIYTKNPADAQAAYNYARNLKAMGDKQRAHSVLQVASQQHPANRQLLGEYGRLALEFDQISVAQKVLERADDPANPDWRVISARGTVLAKQGLYTEAIAFYERAYSLAPDRVSVLNNLALAYTMDGKPDKAEPLMRRAVAAAGADEKVRQNLTLVLGVQGKYDEAKVAARGTSAFETADENIEYLRSIVKADAKRFESKASSNAWNTKVVTR